MKHLNFMHDNLGWNGGLSTLQMLQNISQFTISNTFFA